MGRSWAGAEGNLALSVVLRPTLEPAQLPLLTLGAGVLLAEHLGPPFRLKWPNDVLDDQGRKLAGVLAEAEWSGGQLQAVVVGIGVNLASAPGGVPSTCLAAHGRSVDREAFAEGLRSGLAALDVDSVPARWLGCNLTIGRQVTVGDVRGEAVGLDVDGALRVRAATGEVVRVVTGDVGFVGEGGG